MINKKTNAVKSQLAVISKVSLDSMGEKTVSYTSPLIIT